MWAAIPLFVLFFALMLGLVLKPARASPDNPSYNVNVDHAVEIRNGGMLVINQTVRLSTEPEETAELLTNYLLGFPYGYRTNLDYAFAYETANPSSRLELELNVGMGRVGLYGVNVLFPQAVDISNAKQYEFTVVFVFSDNVASEVSPFDETEVTYNASFPAYPSLTQMASETNVTIIVPDGLDYLSSYYEGQGINFTQTAANSKQYFSFTKANLSEFSDVSGWFAAAKAARALELLSVNEVKRSIELSGLEQIKVVDMYVMASRSDNLGEVTINLPIGAFDVSASTELGDIPSSDLKSTQGSTHTTLGIIFSTPFAENEEARFAVSYQLPWKDYVTTEDWKKFKTTLTVLESPEWTIRKLTVNMNLPEGAVLLTIPSAAGLSNIENGAYRSSLSLSLQNATRFDDLSMGLEYERVVFWDSFRPTLWIGSIVTIVAAIAAVLNSYKPTVTPLPTGIVPLRVEDLKNFIDSYDEKEHLQREIESLEAQASKGKIPRRRYRVRKKTIEGRLSSLSRDLVALRSRLSAAGPRYTDLMRQLEVAEAEQQGVVANINRTEIRYRRGEISAAAYHRLLEDYYRRRDRAKTTIDGVLLRLKEELG